MRWVRIVRLFSLLTALGVVSLYRFPWRYVTGSSLPAWLVYTEVRTVCCADGLCQLAERRYISGDFEASERLCRLAMELAPEHAPARARWTENQFVLAQGRAKTTSAGER